MVRCAWLVVLLLAVPLCLASEWKRPNIVVILVDDAGYMDFGGYGGEARTPNIDALADEGVRFSNYHTSPLCAPSRAMLLTGIDNHLTGVATIPEVLDDEQRGRQGYSMHLEEGVQTVATKLRQAGYRTYMTGKWHLGSRPEDLPVAHGFDRSVALDASGADNWEQKSYMPYYDHAPWFEDGEPAQLPDDFYSSEFLVDRMIDYLDADRSEQQPFFAYIAFQAIHIPVQAPRAFTDRYEGVYDEGWDVLRERRWQKARSMGLIPEGAELADMHPSLRRWESLSGEEQRMYSRSMAVNAGMLDAMDHHIGRFVDYLRASDVFDNTLFVIASDNGPEFSNPMANAGMRWWLWRNGYTHDLETLGEKGSMVFIGPEWASAASSPGRLFKFYASEGGIRVPLIVSGPGVGALGIVPAFSFVTDIAPTILDFAEVPPDVREAGVAMTGRSLRGVLDSSTVTAYPPDTPVGMEVSGNSALFKDDYKLVRNSLPHGDGQWRLFYLKEDPGETRDLAERLPERFREMRADYDAYAQRMGVVALPEGFNPFTGMMGNVLRKQWTFYGLWISGGLLVLILGIAALIWRRSGSQADERP
jgi:arylsulfatase/uncharacterized sulfatase